MMVCDYKDEYILDLLFGQLAFFQIAEKENFKIKLIYSEVKSRIEYNFSHTDNKYYKKGEHSYFNPFH